MLLGLCVVSRDNFHVGNVTQEKIFRVNSLERSGKGNSKNVGSCKQKTHVNKS